MVEKLFIKHKLLSLKEKKRKANGNTVNSPPTQVDGNRGRKGSLKERRPQSEYHTGNHGMRREERRKSKSLQRLNEDLMDLDNFDYKANGMALFIFPIGWVFNAVIIFMIHLEQNLDSKLWHLYSHREIHELVHFEIYIFFRIQIEMRLSEI